jgi:RND superfamily putative drug exporter
MLGAIREHHERGAGAGDSVVAGLTATGRTITSAAAIMVAVALGFALDPSVMVKTIGVGLASAVIVDVTLVRLILVPAALTLMGRANWWLPRWLDRLLPRPTAPDTDLDPADRRPHEPRPRRALVAPAISR